MARRRSRPVAKIIGPGNAYVAAAKRQVFGTVGIDMIAGPSEVLVIADRDNDPDWIAADLLAQAEHDVGAQSILITDDAALRRGRRGRRRAPAAHPAAGRNGKRQLARFWRDHPRAGSRRCAVPLANRIAAEHLELALADADAMIPKIRNAGAIFVGRHTPEVIGDYVGGSNHVLPTARSARFSSGLGVLDYMKRTSILRLGADQLARPRTGGDRACPFRRARGACPLGRHPSQPRRARDDERHSHRLCDVVLDETIGRSTPDVEHERAVAIFDLIEENFFEPAGHDERSLPAQPVADRFASWSLRSPPRPAPRLRPISCR